MGFVKLDFKETFQALHIKSLRCCEVGIINEVEHFLRLSDYCYAATSAKAVIRPSTDESLLVGGSFELDVDSDPSILAFYKDGDVFCRGGRWAAMYTDIGFLYEDSDGYEITERNCTSYSCYDIIVNETMPLYDLLHFIGNYGGDFIPITAFPSFDKSKFNGSGEDFDCLYFDKDRLTDLLDHIDIVHTAGLTGELMHFMEGGSSLRISPSDDSGHYIDISLG